ncbi:MULTISPECIES: helix-turn-helix domain-containing protein [unclassified Cohnella]|uniref:response regulator n=1 Tax=unclassified Cohnella TaxID=2636738 RepID=UPI00117CD798|nr:MULTISPECIES: helix-turn-helix domain-containing protein [unclassified Cohnella]
MRNLIKLMIVEDEWLVREGLKSTIPWEELQCEIVAEADSGGAALPLLEKTRPDVILTDIRMPGMDGLEMAQQAVRMLPEVEIVFLTGFDEFAYAQRALKIGSADYVLKPTNPDELMQVIRRVGDKVRKRRAGNHVERLLSQTRFRDSGTIVASKLFYDLLMDSAGDKERELFQELLGEQALALGAYRVAIVELDRRARGAEEKKRLAAVEDRLYETEFTFARVLDKLAVLLGEGAPQEEWTALAAELGSSLGSRDGLLTAWSEPRRSLDELSSAYEEAERRLAAHTGIAPSPATRLTELPNIERLKSELRETIRYIEEHYQEDISLQEIAASIPMSESNFSRLFKKQTGVSFVEYLTQLRMEKAKELLLRPDEKVYEIALAVGYQDSRYFSQIFRKYTGDTPSEYRSRFGIG